MYQSSACPYAASLSACSSLQPRSGLELEPHSTVSRACGVYSSAPHLLDFSASNAECCGSIPAFTRRLISSSCARLTSTPGCVKPADFAGLPLGSAFTLIATSLYAGLLVSSPGFLAAN